MSEECRQLKPCTGFRFSLMAFVIVAAVALIPSSAEAQSCSASGSLTPLPGAGFDCENGLVKGQQFRILYALENTSRTVPEGKGVAADLRGVVDATLACEGAVCESLGFVGGPTVELPGTLNLVRCTELNPGVEDCRVDPTNSNVVEIEMTSEGVQLGADETVAFAVVVVEADIAVEGSVCGFFFTRADTDPNGIVVDDPRCPAGITGGAGGSSLIFFPPEVVPAVPGFGLLLLAVLLCFLGARWVARRTVNA